MFLAIFDFIAFVNLKIYHQEFAYGAVELDCLLLSRLLLDGEWFRLLSDRSSSSYEPITSVLRLSNKFAIK